MWVTCCVVFQLWCVTEWKLLRDGSLMSLFSSPGSYGEAITPFVNPIQPVSKLFQTSQRNSSLKVPGNFMKIGGLVGPLMTLWKERLLSEVSYYQTAENLKGACGFMEGQITNLHWGLHSNGCLRNHTTDKSSLPRGSSGVTPQSPLKNQPCMKQ